MKDGYRRFGGIENNTWNIFEGIVFFEEDV